MRTLSRTVFGAECELQVLVPFLLSRNECVALVGKKETVDLVHAVRVCTGDEVRLQVAVPYAA